MADIGSRNGPCMFPVSRQNAEWMGRIAELVVAFRLLLSGYRVIAWRWRCAVGKIDLITTKGEQVIFIEVKFRMKAGISAIPSPRQRGRICRAAAHFLQHSHRSTETPCQFDLILLSWRPLKGHKRFHHIQNAWQCGA